MRKLPAALSLIAFAISPALRPITSARAAVPFEAYWTGSVSNLWNDLNANNSNFNTDASTGTNTNALPGGITKVYFATTTPTPAHLATQLGADLAVRSVTVLGTQTSAVSIGGNNTLYLGSGGLNIQPAAGPLSVSANIALFDDQTWTNANPSSPLTVTGAVTGTNNLTLNGNISLNGANAINGNLAVNTGTVNVAGIINGSVTVTSATVSPGPSPTSLSIFDNYTQQSDATLQIALAGTTRNQLDFLTVYGTASLDGTLQLSLLNGFLPNIGDSFQILYFGNRTGDFSSIQILNAPGYQFTPSYTAHYLTLTTTAVPEPATITLLAASALLLPRRKRHPN